MHILGCGALVTGGASGLGEATVRRLVAAGAHVTIADLNADRGAALAAELGDRARFVAVDVLSTEAVSAAVDATLTRAPLRIVVSCAGVGAGGRVVNRDGTPHDLDAFERTVRVYLVGTFNVMRLAAAAMAANDPLEDGERGVVVNTASAAAFEGKVGQAAYAAAKAGIVGLTLPAARDLSPLGIRVVAIAPGTFATPAMLMVPQAGLDKLVAESQFPKRLGHADEFAALVEHIATNVMLNGETIRLDGGLRFAPR